MVERQRPVVGDPAATGVCERATRIPGIGRHPGGDAVAANDAVPDRDGGTSGRPCRTGNVDAATPAAERREIANRDAARDGDAVDRHRRLARCAGHADRQHRAAAADDGGAGARPDELDAHVDRDAAGVRAGADRDLVAALGGSKGGRELRVRAAALTDVQRRRRRWSRPKE